MLRGCERPGECCNTGFEIETNKNLGTWILREQIRLAMEQLPSGRGASLIVALILCYAVRHIVPYANIFGWVTLVLLTVLSEILLYHRFSKVREDLFTEGPWKNAYLILVLIAGVIWGLSAFIIFPAGNPELISLFVLVMGSIAATTTISHSSIKFAPVVWVGPVVLFYVIRSAMQGGEFGYTICLLCILYLLTVVSYSSKHNKSIASAIALKFKNLELLEEVRRVNDSLCLEIAERKIAQETLRESEEKFRLAFLTSPDAINLNRVQDGMYLDINEGFTTIMDYTREEAIGRTSLEIDIWDDPKDRRHMVATLEREGFVQNMEARFRGKDGRIIIGLMSARVLRIGREDVILSITRDITERNRAEMAQRESEERFALAMEATKDGLWDWNLDTDMIYYSPGYAAMLGYASGEIPAHACSWADRIHPEDRDAALKANMDCIENGRDDFEVEFRMQAKNGEWRWILGRGKAVGRDGNGRAFRAVGTHTDITERKRAEEERRWLEDRLQRAEKMEALGTLAGGVAHDLNNVLGVVVGYSELLVNDSGESSPAGSKAMKILKGGLRAAAIVQDLLTLARRGVSNRKVLNLNNIVQECKSFPEFAGISSCHPNIRLKTDLEAHLLNISGSAVHLGKALMNLVSNAAEAMPKGGVITIKTGNQYLDLPVCGYDEFREGDYVVLSVSDTGEGIPARDLKRIFEPFYTKKVMCRSGTGLGLAVIWGTVKDHLGYINVESQEGKGSVFTLYFPVTREEISRDQVPVSAAQYMGNGESILIVDDVEEQRELAGTMLKKLNYAAVSVPSGEEAVEYLKQNAVNLVVLDMIMDPGMDGLDTYAKILETHPRQRAIIVSGFSETERVSRAQTLGAGTYVKKPYILEKLGLAVRKELDQPA